MCMYIGNMCICVPNMKFLCLIVWPGEVCTDTNGAVPDTNDANADEARHRKHDCIRLFQGGHVQV